MPDLEELSERIEAELTRAQRRRQRVIAREPLPSRELTRRFRAFHDHAARLVRGVVLPRLERLAGYFDAAQLEGPDRRRGPRCTLHLRQTARVPATVTLDVELYPDAPVEQLLTVCQLHLRPSFLRYERCDELGFRLNRIDDARLARWIDDKLVEFVATYFRAETVALGQDDVLCTDPVSCARFSRASAAAECEHQGHTYYFVHEANRRRFQADPGRFVAAATEA